MKGPKGTLTLGLSDDISYEVEEGEISVKPANDTKPRARLLGHAAHAGVEPGRPA